MKREDIYWVIEEEGCLNRFKLGPFKLEVALGSPKEVIDDLLRLGWKNRLISLTPNYFIDWDMYRTVGIWTLLGPVWVGYNPEVSFFRQSGECSECLGYDWKHTKKECLGSFSG